jgi:hypothetical protein
MLREIFIQHRNSQAHSVLAHRETSYRVRGGKRRGSFVDGRLPEMSNFCLPPRQSRGVSLGRIGVLCTAEWRSAFPSLKNEQQPLKPEDFKVWRAE